MSVTPLTIYPQGAKVSGFPFNAFVSGYAFADPPSGGTSIDSPNIFTGTGWMNLVPESQTSVNEIPPTLAASEPPNNGTGWVVNNTAFQNTVIAAGTWNFSVGLQAIIYAAEPANTVTITGNLVCRLWVYHQDDTYTQVGSEMLQSGITLTYDNSNSAAQGTTYTWTETFDILALGQGDTLYYEYYFQVTGSSTTGSFVENIALGLCGPENIIGGALAPTYIETPGYTPAPAPLTGPHGGLAFLTGRQKTLHFSGSFDLWTGVLSQSQGITPDLDIDGHDTVSEYVINWSGGNAVGIPDDIYTGEVLIRIWGGEKSYNDPKDYDPTGTHLINASNSTKLQIELVNGGGIQGGPAGNIQISTTAGVGTPNFFQGNAIGYLSHIVGTWTFDVDVEEAFEIVPYTLPGIPFPAMGTSSASGGLLATGPYGKLEYWYDKARVGGTQAMACDCTITEYTVSSGSVVAGAIILPTFAEGASTPVSVSESHTILAGRSWDVQGDFIEVQARFYSNWGSNNFDNPPHPPPWGFVHPPISGSTQITDGMNVFQYEADYTEPNANYSYVFDSHYNLTGFAPGFGAPTYDAIPWTSKYPVKWFDFQGGIALNRIVDNTNLGWDYEDLAGSFQISPTRHVARTLKLYRYNEPYPDSVNVVIDGGEVAAVTGGTFARTDKQIDLSFFVFKADNPLTGQSGNAEATPFHDTSAELFTGFTGFNIDSDWITSSGESNNNRCLMLGRKWDAGTLQHLLKYTLFDGSSLTGWAAGANTTLSLDNGIKAAVSGGPGSIVWTAPGDPQEWEAYRYLEIVIKATNANQAFVVTAANVNGANPQAKHWNTATGDADTFTTVEIDLCLPFDLETDGVDPQYTRFPVGSLSGNHWGVDTVDQLTISGLVTGQDYTIQSISLKQKDHTHLNLIEPNFFIVPASPPDPTTGDIDPWYYPNAIADTDGRQSLEEFYMIVRFNPVPAWLQKTVSDLLGQIAAHPGWAATLTADADIPTDGWHNEDQPAAYVWGGGLTYDKTNGFTLGFDVDMSDGLPHTIPVQDAFDGLMGWPPFIGDPYENDGTYSTDYTTPAIPLRCYHIFRGGVYGILSDGTVPEVGGVVGLSKSTDGTDTGEGTSDFQGEYLSGDPFAPDRTRQNVIFDDPSQAINNIVLWDGLRRRVSYGAAATSTIFTPWNFESDYGDMHRTAAIGKAIYYWHATNVVPPYEVGINQALVASDGQSSNSRMIVDRQMSHKIALVYQSGTALAGYKIYEAESFDDGATWGTPAQVFPVGQYPDVTVSATTGTIIRSAYVASNESSGTITAKVQQSGDLAAGEAFTFVDAAGAQITVANDTFHIEEAENGLFYMHVNTGSATRVYFSSDDGATWTICDPSWSINGGTYPTLACGKDGEILLFARQSGNLVGAICYPGQASAAGFACQKTAGMAFGIAADTFQVSQGLDMASRWVLTCVAKNENIVSTWFSTDAGGAASSGIITFARVLE